MHTEKVAQVIRELQTQEMREVNLVDVRNALRSLSRREQDAALLDLRDQGRLMVSTYSSIQAAVPDEMRAAALRLGITDHHLVRVR